MPFDPYGNWNNGARTLGEPPPQYFNSSRYFGQPTMSVAPGVTPIAPASDPYGFGQPAQSAALDPWNPAPYQAPDRRLGGPQNAYSNAPAAANAEAPYNAGQLEWIAAINGQTPEDYLRTQQSINTIGRPPLSPYESWYEDQTNGRGLPGAIFDSQQTTQNEINRMNEAIDYANGQQDNIFNSFGQNTQRGYDTAGWMAATNAPLINQLQGSIAENNALQTQGLNDFRTAVGNRGAWDMANINTFAQAANAPMQMTASPYVGDARSNPEDIARQNQVFGQLQGAANGSLDQTSQAAHAYANAQDVANQRRAAQTLEAAGNGALDIDPTTMPGMQEMYAMANGSKDVHVGQEDPAAYAAMVDARNQLSELTKPEVTAQEKLAYEIARQQQEQDERATRSALETDAARRGVSGVGTNIARNALAAQQTSRNRMLQDMDANSIAVQRAMSALNNYGNLSATMSAQANQIAMQNQSTQAGALTNYAGISSNVLTNNMNRRLAAEQAAYDAYATLRAQGFSEEYARGVAADNMANANADRRLGAMNSSATLATNMRNAGDAMNMFNQSQRQQQSQFADTFHANREDAAYGRQRDLFGAKNTVGDNYMRDQGQLFDATTTTAGTNFGRTSSGVTQIAGLNGQTLGAQQFAIGNEGANLGRQSGVVQTRLGNTTQRAGLATAFGAQKVQDATVLRNVQQQDAATRDARNAVNGTYYPGGSYNGTEIVSNQPYYTNPVNDPQYNYVNFGGG